MSIHMSTHMSIHRHYLPYGIPGRGRWDAAPAQAPTGRQPLRHHAGMPTVAQHHIHHAAVGMPVLSISLGPRAWLTVPWHVCTHVRTHGYAHWSMHMSIDFGPQSAHKKGHTDPEPSNPEPSNPEPSNPEPSNPEPSNPEPSNPEPSRFDRLFHRVLHRVLH